LRDVRLDFELDPSTLAQVASADLAGKHPAFIRWTYLRAPVHLRIGDAELLRPVRPRSALHGAIPLLDMATWALELVRNLPAKGTAVYDCCRFGRCLRFTRFQEVVQLRSFLKGTSYDVGYDALLRAWERFGADVQARVRERAPGFRTNPFWSAWLDGMEYSAIPLPLPVENPSANLVVLAFEPSREAVDGSAPLSPGTESMSAVEYSCFELRFRLNVGGAELFKWDASEGSSGMMVSPILHFALSGLSTVRETGIAGRGYYLFPESSPFLRFEMAGEDVLVQYSPFDQVAQVRYTILLGAWEEFAARVCAYLLTEVPELRENPEWEASLRDAGLRDLP
jgi:hypothetical protein